MWLDHRSMRGTAWRRRGRWWSHIPRGRNVAGPPLDAAYGVASARAVVEPHFAGSEGGLATARWSVGVRADGLVEPLAGAVEPLLADLRQRLAALPQRERLLERGAAGLEGADHLDELLAGLFVARLGRGGVRHGGPPRPGWLLRCGPSWRGSGRRRPAPTPRCPRPPARRR